MPARPRSAVWRVAGVLLLPVLGTWVWYASQPSLVWYVSPPMDAQRHRIRVLVPRGWEIDDQAGPHREAIVFRPADHAPRWLRWIFPETDSQSAMFLDWSSEPPDQGFAIQWDRREHVATAADWPYPIAYRALPRTTVHSSVLVAYSRQSRAAFNATHSSICNSLRIEPPDETQR